MGKPLTLQWIQEQVRQDHFLYTVHADEERRNDGLAPEDVRTALLTGRVIEEYPEDPHEVPHAWSTAGLLSAMSISYAVVIVPVGWF